MQLPNPYTLEETIERTRFGLAVKARNGNDYQYALELLEKAVDKSLEDEAYRAQMEEALLRGSTIELRELLSAFGDYMETRRSEEPWYPHRAAVNGIDTALYHVKLGAAKEAGLITDIEL